MLALSDHVDSFDVDVAFMIALLVQVAHLNAETRVRQCVDYFKLQERPGRPGLTPSQTQALQEEITTLLCYILGRSDSLDCITCLVCNTCIDVFTALTFLLLWNQECAGFVFVHNFVEQFWQICRE